MENTLTDHYTSSASAGEHTKRVHDFVYMQLNEVDGEDYGTHDTWSLHDSNSI